MNINLPDSVVRNCVDAFVVQTTGNIKYADARGNDAQRLTYHVGEMVISMVRKDMMARKFLK